MEEERPNVVFRGGALDGQQMHLGRGEEPSTYRAENGETYQATQEWEDALRVFRLARRSAAPRV